MIRRLLILLILAGSFVFQAVVPSQTPAGSNSSAQDGNKPSNSEQKPAVTNPFPEDTSSVPVLPSNSSPTPVAWPQPSGSNTGEDAGAFNAAAMLPTEDTDPVRSPDDPVPDAAGGDSSSSLQNIDSLLSAPDKEQPEKKRKHGKQEAPEEFHQETAKEDIEIGSFYLDQKNWRAALSRFQSGLILDPEEPEVYWGLAEAERNLGKFADAKAHYERLLEYDPDGKHAKQARKALKEPALATAQAPAHGQTPAAATQ